MNFSHLIFLHVRHTINQVIIISSLFIDCNQFIIMRSNQLLDHVAKYWQKTFSSNNYLILMPLIKSVSNIVDIGQIRKPLPILSLCRIHSHQSIYATGARRSILAVIKWTRCLCCSFLIALNTCYVVDCDTLSDRKL